ncbi:sugar porter family MFS transporter [Falsarthrobacter nasiphocae]|uniref:Sugar porter (SP) family MFS transporter n=1 Tax=Falsarthrobacter nasiphocae TaxID=189863 RepID=A0AAE4C7K2_9MICC|nr:sugar porter family MFS transporter [Falsarthrobacter nasiphocae]MDR6892629.1 sugar porter (SP) family MFS transporter [Falsarthrobacter nasiphocae]
MTTRHDPTPTQTAHRGRIIAVTVAAALGGLLFGFDTAVINGAVDAIKGEFGVSESVLGFTVAITLIGCAVGAWFTGGLADRFGRRPVMTLAAAVFVVQSAGSAFAFSAYDLMAWRLLGGLAIGAASVIAPAYISEIAPAKYRGALASLQQLAITVGIFLSLLNDAGLAALAGGASETLWLGMAAWRWMLLVGVVPALVYGILSWRIPESPQYLVRAGRDDEAAEVLRTVTGVEDPAHKISEIRRTADLESRRSLADLKGSVLGLHPLLWVGMGMAVLQQFVGINAIFYYSTTLWKSVGFSEEDSFTTSVITAIVNVAMTFVAIGLVDRVGRRRLLLWGSVGMFVGLVMASYSFAHATTVGGELSLPAPYGPIALVGANLFVVFFAATWGPILWVALGEIFPNRMRSRALGVSTSANWIANFVVTLLVPIVTARFGTSALYAGFAFFAALSFVFVIKFFPEFSGRELEDRPADA